MKPLKVLNLYAGIGGNRKLWQNVEVTAVEQNAEIAKIYSDFFPDDKMIVGDAHQFLLEHFAEYDFIWSSPPCQSHTRMRNLLNRFEQYEKKYPDMVLYQEIIFLQHFAKGLWAVENVISYYKPLIQPYESGNHYFWANFHITNMGMESRNIKRKSTFAEHIEEKKQLYGFNGLELKGQKGQQVLNNAVNPKLGLHVFNCALGAIPPMPLGTLFENDESKKYA